MRVLVPIGTCGEVAKLSPVVHLMRRRGLDVRVLRTGEDGDRMMAGIFFDRFGLVPDEVWDPPTAEPEMHARLVELAFREIDTRRPDCVLVTGSASTVPIFCLAARRFGVPVVHCEAGLRSLDETSVDETNQKVAAQTASLHMAPTRTAAHFLEGEGVDPDRIRVVGSPAVDALRICGVHRRPPATRTGIVVADTRVATSDAVRLWSLVDLILRLSDEFGCVTFPVQPETRARLVDSGDWSRLRESPVRLFPPLPYDGMVELVATSRVVVSDGGELEEAAAWLGVPVVVLGNSTSRWEGLCAGIATLVGFDGDRAIEAVQKFTSDAEQERVAATECPYGDGRSAERISSILCERATGGLLDLTAPDLIGKPIDVLDSGELFVGAAS